MNERKRTNRGETANKSWISCGLKIAGVIVATVVIIVAAILAAPDVTRFGFCHGWWLKLNPWAHYWWLCECGPEFERSLYPDDIEIIVSACRDPQSVTYSLDGRYMIVNLGQKRENYLFDLVAGQEQLWPYQTWPWEYYDELGFQTDTLVLIRVERGDWKIVDIADGSDVNPIFLEPIWRDNALEVPPETLQIFREADRVLLKTGSSVALVLNVNLKQNPEGNYIFRYPAQHFMNKTAELEAIFSKNGIVYEKSEPCWPEYYQPLCPSHDGRFVARDEAIFMRHGDGLQKLAELPREQLVNQQTAKLGWAHDDSGVYLSFYPKYIQEAGWMAVPKYRIPGAIVKLKVPEAYR